MPNTLMYLDKLVVADYRLVAPSTVYVRICFGSFRARSVYDH
jgi:hypothetical protein